VCGSPAIPAGHPGYNFIEARRVLAFLFPLGIIKEKGVCGSPAIPAGHPGYNKNKCETCSRFFISIRDNKREGRVGSWDIIEIYGTSAIYNEQKSLRLMVEF
jgi:hypothetical protein